MGYANRAREVLAWHGAKGRSGVPPGSGRTDCERVRRPDEEGARLPEAVLVYITAANEEEALRIGREVVARRLAACANVVPKIASIYWWEGAMQEEDEALLLLKTLRPAVPALMAAVRALHSYSVPAISVVALADVNPAYLDWLVAEVRLPAGEGRELPT